MRRSEKEPYVDYHPMCARERMGLGTQETCIGCGNTYGVNVGELTELGNDDYELNRFMVSCPQCGNRNLYGVSKKCCICRLPMFRAAESIVIRHTQHEAVVPFTLWFHPKCREGAERMRHECEGFTHKPDPFFKVVGSIVVVIVVVVVVWILFKLLV